MSKHARRGGLVEWLTFPEFTHAVHLAPNRPTISYGALEIMFSRFCLDADRYMLGVKHVHLRNSHDRLNMLVMPEKLGVNPHLHGVANLSAEYCGERVNGPWERDLDRIWRNIAGASASLVIQPDPDRGAAIYATKEAFRRDHEYLHSWFFHRNDKLQKRPNAASLHGAAPKKAVLNS